MLPDGCSAAALRPGDVGRDARVLARLHVLAFVVAPVGDGVDPLDAEHLLGGTGGWRQQAEVAAGIGDVLLDDQLVLGVERDLGVVATPTFGCAAIARLSGSVSETWLSPLRSNSSSNPSWRVLRCFNVAIFSVRFFARRPLAPSSSASVRSRRLR